MNPSFLPHQYVAVMQDSDAAFRIACARDLSRENNLDSISMQRLWRCEAQYLIIYLILGWEVCITSMKYWGSTVVY